MKLTIFVFVFFSISLINLSVGHGADDENEDDKKCELTSTCGQHTHPELREDARFIPKNVDELTTEYWQTKARNFVEQQMSKPENKNVAKNIILFLGDGMGLATQAATRMYMGAEEMELSFEKFPNTGMSKTYCVDAQVADSACSATAYLTGIKGNDGTIGVNAKVKYNDCDTGLDKANHVNSIAAWAMDAGKVGGLVTTTRVTHASPAGVYSHTSCRDWETDKDIRDESDCDPANHEDIAEQLVRGEIGRKLKVIMGGGRRGFLNYTQNDGENIRGRRTDGQDLIEEWKTLEGTRDYIWNREQLLNVDPETTDHILGLFGSSHMEYYANTVANNQLDLYPTLAEMTDKAIDVLSKNEKGFFLFVEGGRIDHGHHDNWAKRALEETVQFSKAIELAVSKLNMSETLIVVTADHSHSFNMAGYPVRVADRYHSKSATLNRKKVPSVKDVNPQELETDFWLQKAQNALNERIKIVKNEKLAKNVIFFLGDGMSVPTVSATRMYMGGEEVELSFEKFPHVGLSKTYCVDRQVSDSAATATAFFTGVKANYGTIGVNAKTVRYNCEHNLNKANHVEGLMHWAQAACKGTGLVTNARVTHATPAGAYAHTAARSWENDLELGLDCNPEEHLDIAEQLVYNEVSKNFHVILGGGRREFYNSTETDVENSRGYRGDGRNLVEEWKDVHAEMGRAEYIWNRQQLKDLDIENTDYVLGLFEADHMRYAVDVRNLGLEAEEPTLKDLTETAIKMMQKHENGYLLFIEGGRIDHAHHSNYAYKALDETKEFSEAIDLARHMTDEADTLIVVTADHSHVMMYNGYPARGSDVLSANQISDMDNLPYQTLSYGNGPGYPTVHVAGDRADLSLLDYKNPNLRYAATVPLSSETHGGDDVAVYASGPHSHLFVGNYEQNNIPYLIAFAAKIGEYNENPGAECHDDNGGAVTFKLSMIWLFLAYLLHSVIRLV